MARVPVQIFDFTAGWLSGLEARKDLRVYYKGGREITNMVGLTTGGQKRRGGTRQLAEIVEAANGAVLARFEFSTEQAYLHVFLDGKIRVFMEGVAQADVTAPWSGSELNALQWAQSLDTMLIAHRVHHTQKMIRQGAHDAWALSDIAFTNIPTYRFGDPTVYDGTPAAKSGNTTFTASGDTFIAEDVGLWIVGNQGRALITGYTSATQVSISVKQEFKDTATIEAGDWSIEETAWSDDRGWPGALFLFEGRTFVGGSDYLLQSSWGSSSGLPFDFKMTFEALDDEAVSADLEGARVNAIRRIYALDDLFLFTTGGVFAVTGTPITPESYLPHKHTATPAADIQPIELEDAVAFISADDDGNPISLHELHIDELSTETRYVAADMNTLCPLAVVDPVDLTARKGRKGSSSTNHAYVVNGDGSMGVLHSRIKEKIRGWTKWETCGNAGTDAVLRAAVVGNDIYVLVRRTIDGVTRYFLEIVDDDAIWDCSQRQTSETAQSVWTGFDYLEGETVAVWADGARRDDAVVTGGNVTVTDGGEAIDVFAMEAGMPFEWVLETMPFEAQLADGTLVGKAHRLADATIRVRDAYEMKVNGRRVAFRRFRGMQLDTPLEPYTGLKQLKFLGWRKRTEEAATVRMTGELPITIESATVTIAQ